MKKKTVLMASLALLTMGSAAVAADSSLCMSSASLVNIPLTSVMKGPGENRYNVASDYQYQTSADYTKYIAWQFMMNGIKAKDAQDALNKAKTALMNLTGNPTLEPDSYGYGFVCSYPVDFSKMGDNYNGVYPVAVLAVSGTDYDNLMVKVPAKGKIR